MKDLVPEDVVGVIMFLLPGFLAAAIFHGLTAHKKADSFERVVEALIFTILVQGVTTIVMWFFLFLGRHIVPWGMWDSSAAQLWSLLVAAFLGLGFAAAANADWPHKKFRDWKCSRSTSHPSQWYTAFCQGQRNVTLHLEGDRRLYGWPLLWPDHSDEGHFIIEHPQWMLPNNEFAPLHAVEYMLVPANEVELVEFMRDWHEITDEQKQQMDEIEEKLINLQDKEDANDENENPSAAPRQ